MSFNTFGKIFRFTTWGESHGPAIGCVVDGCPPNIALSEKQIQVDMDRRRPGKSKFTSQRKESDKVEILSGVFQGKTTGTPISMIIYNKDARSRDYETIKNKFRPGHADYTYLLKYGIRDYRGGGRQSARETAARVAAGGERGSGARGLHNASAQARCMPRALHAARTQDAARAENAARAGYRKNFIYKHVERFGNVHI